MELPDWVADEVPARTRGGVPLLLVVKLFRHGSAVVDPETGGRRTYWQGQPARLTGASKRALDGAIDELVALGVLRVHIPPRPGTTRGYSIGFDLPAWGVVPGPCGPGRGVEPADNVGASPAPGSLAGGAGSSTLQIQGGAEGAGHGESRAYVNGGGGDPDPLPARGEDEIRHHPSGELREQILRTLRGLKVDSPGALLASHGPVRVLGAIGELSLELHRGGVRNPAGWLVAALLDRDRIFAPAGEDVLDDVLQLDQEFEARRRKYAGPLQQWALARQRGE